MTKNDQDKIAEIYLEGFSSETYRNTGHDDDRYDEDDGKIGLSYDRLFKEQPISSVGQLVNRIFMSPAYADEIVYEGVKRGAISPDIFQEFLYILTNGTDISQIVSMYMKD